MLECIMVVTFWVRAGADGGTRNRSLELSEMANPWDGAKRWLVVMPSPYRAARLLAGYREFFLGLARVSRSLSRVGLQPRAECPRVVYTVRRAARAERVPLLRFRLLARHSQAFPTSPPDALSPARVSACSSMITDRVSNAGECEQADVTAQGKVHALGAVAGVSILTCPYFFDSKPSRPDSSLLACRSSGTICSRNRSLVIRCMGPASANAATSDPV